MKILILEDEPTTAVLLRKIMSRFGDVDLARDGKEAMDFYMKSVDVASPYDLICLDIMVPEIDGQEVLRQIRLSEENLGRDNVKDMIKIVMITALQDSDNLMTAFNAQSDGYIFKPFNIEKIEKTLKKLDLI